MALKKRGEYWYGEGHADIRAELAQYSEQNGYPIDDFADLRCRCGSDEFYLLTDEMQGVAIRRCDKCSDEHFIGDSADFAEEAEVAQRECVCAEGVFQITAGLHRYRNEDDSLSNDVRWLYLGCRCPSCGVVGCYADWKNEYNGYQELLARM